MTTLANEQTVPPHATLLRDFVNTHDVEYGDDAIDSPTALAGWLREHGLIERDAGATREDLALGAGLREGLRAAMHAHHDGRSEGAELDAVCAALPLRVAFGASKPTLRPVAGGVRGGLGRIVAAVAASVADGTWTRLKVCPDPTCQYAFVDTSKNRSRTWCSMRACGNRSKTRAYRARRKGPEVPQGAA